MSIEVIRRHFRKLAPQIFTGSGTYTPTPGMAFCILECVGGGAGGGGCANSTAGNQGSAGGGGGGSYARAIKTAAQVGASQTVTVGGTAAGGTAGNNAGTAGNDSSVGSLCVGKGGSPGSGAAADGNSAGGAGGVAGTGDFKVPGEAGCRGQSASVLTVALFTNHGGNAGLGFGAGGRAPNTTTPNDGTNYGGGGSGGRSANGGGAAAGGVGAQGLVVITEFMAS